jgi:hypothetical protein
MDKLKKTQKYQRRLSQIPYQPFFHFVYLYIKIFISRVLSTYFENYTPKLHNLEHWGIRYIIVFNIYSY